MQLIKRFSFVLLLLLVVGLDLYALPRASLEDGGNRQASHVPSSAIGSIKGVVMDSVSNQPLEFATIAVYLQKTDSLVTGGITDKDGQFHIKEIRPSVYKVKIDFMDYETLFINQVKIGKEVLHKDIGAITVAPDASSLNEVEVVAEKRFMQNSLDRKAYSVEKIMASEGGDATEVLQNIPSVEVDIEGQVSLRGSSNVTILIDGKPSSLTGASRTAILEQIPASSIETIEVITNPSAKFDPDGMSGIINIILKRQKKPGLNGGINLSAGTRYKYNGAANINYRTSKLNLFANYSYRYDTRFREGETFREIIFSDTTSYLDQESYSDRIRKTQMLKLGTDLYLNGKNTLSLVGTYNLRNSVSDGVNEYRELDQDHLLQNLYTRSSFETEPGSSADVNVNYSKEFKNPKQQLTADIRYSISDRLEDAHFEQDTLNLDGTPSGIPSALQNNLINTAHNITNMQLDYSHPFHKKAKLETGWKTTLRNINNDFQSETFDQSSGEFISDSLLNNQFLYEEQIHAIYGTYGHKIKGFSFQLGTRLEQAYTTSTLITTSEMFTKDYFSIFPSVHLAQELGNEQTVMLSFSRRINRPSIRALNPFNDNSDPQNLRLGNPDLNPEYINAYEIGYGKYWQAGHSLSSAIYYRQIHDVIKRIRSADSTGATTTTWENLDDGISYGVELIGVISITEWWRLNGSFNFFRTIIDGSNLETAMTNDALGWSTKFTSMMQLPHTMELQFSGRYRAPGVHVQGSMRARYSFDMALKKSLFEKKGSIGIRMSDIFNTRQFAFDSSGPGYTQEAIYNRESRIVFLTFSYRFGKKMNSRKKGGRNGGPQDGLDGGGMDF